MLQGVPYTDFNESSAGANDAEIFILLFPNKGDHRHFGMEIFS